MLFTPLTNSSLWETWRHKGTADISALILNLNNTWRRVSIFTPQPFYPSKSLSGRFGNWHCAAAILIWQLTQDGQHHNWTTSNRTANNTTKFVTCVNRLIYSTYRESKDDSWIVQPVAQSQLYTGFIIAKFSSLSEVCPKPNTLPLCHARFVRSKGGFEPVIVL